MRHPLRVLGTVIATAIASAAMAQEAPITSGTPRKIGVIEWLPGGVRNVTLGFVAPYPGPGFVVPAEMQSQFDSQTAATNGAIAQWVFQRGETGETVLIQAINTGKMGGAESDLQSMARGMRGTTTGAIVEDSVIWNGTVKEIRMSSKRPDQMYLRSRCVASGNSRAEPVIICLMTITPEYASLDSMRLGLRLTEGR